MNYYLVLGIPEDADQDAIRTAFRVLARRYHPDAGPGSSVANFRQVLEAYETLADPERRRRHDRELRASRVPHVQAPRPVTPSSTPLRRVRPTSHVTIGSRPGAAFSQSPSEEALLDDILAALRRVAEWPGFRW